MTTLAIVIPTRDRAAALAETLLRLGRLDRSQLGARCEVIVVDNASSRPARAPSRLENGLAVHMHRLDENAGTAARNVAAAATVADWLVMLDDDSSLRPCSIADVLSRTDARVAAVGGDIALPSGVRESGGLPEVIVGCGCAIRRAAFLAVGGYCEAFGFYAEEYDLCAKLIAAGWAIRHDGRLGFEHRKVEAGRCFIRIIERLVRNNGWVITRHAPERERDIEMRRMLQRYERIAVRTESIAGFRSGIEALEATLDTQVRRPLSAAHWNRFIGRAAVEAYLIPRLLALPGADVRLIERGKGVETIEQALYDSGLQITERRRAPAVIGTLSPGPLEDARSRGATCVLAPWAGLHPVGRSATALAFPNSGEVGTSVGHATNVQRSGVR